MSSLISPLVRIALVALVALSAPAFAQSREASERQLANIRQQISSVEQQVRSARSEETSALRALEGLDTEIKLRETLIGGYREQVDVVKAETQTLRRSIGRLENEIDQTKRAYRDRARHAYMHGRRNNLALLLASSSINQMLVRARYLQRFASARRRQVERIQQKTAELRTREMDVQRSLEDTQRLLGQARLEQSQLARRRADRTDLVTQVRSRRGRLERALNQRRADAAQLAGLVRELLAEERRRAAAEAEAARQRELAAQRERERLAEARRQAEIQRRADEAAERARQERSRADAERRTAPTPRAEDPNRTPPPVASATPPPAPPETTAPPPARQPEASAPPPAIDREVNLTGSFQQNRGRLPWPADGTVTGEFGDRTDPVYGTVVRHQGMDISTSPAAPARAVFEGVVNRVGQMPSYGTYIMVRHGEFMTMYGNLSSVSVQQGQQVRAGQVIGRGGTAQDQRGSALFFGLVADGSFVNPRAWLR
ncbi:MAG: peptidoglycan DD-metalloendopeptidase family protein [Bacteroidota bacterium]